MQVSCEVVKDLLPLYHDGVCSDSSRAVVEEHLLECGMCRRELEKMKETMLDRRIQEERNDVVGHHTRAVKKKSLIAGISLAAVLSVPILICLIVNLATGHALNWFFIVLTAIMTLASVTVVPLIIEQRRGLWTLGGFTVSLILLLLTCCLYTGGDWFFVAVIPVLFGLSVLFAPFAVRSLPLKGFAAKNKGLLVMTIDTVLLYAVVTVSCLYSGYSAEYWSTAVSITSFCLLLPWALFLIIRYAKTNGFIKAGLCTVILSSYISFTDNIILFILGEAQRTFMFTDADLRIWNPSTTDANLKLIIFIAGLIVGGSLLAVGFLRKKTES